MNRTLIQPSGWQHVISRLLKKLVRFMFIDVTGSVLVFLATKVLHQNYAAIPRRYRIVAFPLAFGGTTLLLTTFMTLTGTVTLSDPLTTATGAVVCYAAALVALLSERVNFANLLRALIIYPIVVLRRLLHVLAGRR